MKPIILTLTPEEAHNNLALIELAVKSPDGGMKAARAGMPIVDKIQAATAEAQKPDAQ